MFVIKKKKLSPISIEVKDYLNIPNKKLISSDGKKTKEVKIKFEIGF